MPGGILLAVALAAAGFLPAAVSVTREKRYGWAILAAAAAFTVAVVFRIAGAPALGFDRAVRIVVILAVYGSQVTLFAVGVGLAVRRRTPDAGRALPVLLAGLAGLAGLVAVSAVVIASVFAVPSAPPASPPASLEATAAAGSGSPIPLHGVPDTPSQPPDTAREAFGRRVTAALAAVMADEDWSRMMAGADELLTLWHPVVRAEMEERWRRKGEARVPPELRGLADAVPASMGLAYKLQDLRSRVPGGVREGDTFTGTWEGPLTPAEAARFGRLSGTGRAAYWRFEVARVRAGKGSPLVVLFASCEGEHWSLVGYERASPDGQVGAPPSGQ